MATNTILRPKTHAEWLALRAEGIGSSEVATILYLNPFQTPYQLWRIKKGIDPPKTENFAMRAGHYLEDAVSRFYADATGNQIIKRSATDWIIRDKSRPYLQVSPDRTFWLPDGTQATATAGAPSALIAFGNHDAQTLSKNPLPGFFINLQNQKT